MKCSVEMWSWSGCIWSYFRAVCLTSTSDYWQQWATEMMYRRNEPIIWC